jgi:hypothetical protein
MKLPELFLAAMAMVGLASTSLAADYGDWVAKRLPLVASQWPLRLRHEGRREEWRFAFSW